MAGYKKRTTENTDDEQPKTTWKPYIDTITKDTNKRDVKAEKLPKVIKIKYLGDGIGNMSNRYLSTSNTRYDFNGGVPMPISNDMDKVLFVLKAKKNPETWEIVK